MFYFGDPKIIDLLGKSIKEMKKISRWDTSFKEGINKFITKNNF